MNKLYTLTIGIPAHNEEKNVASMLKSLLRQKARSYCIEKIYVMLDGCSDNTEKIVKKIALKNKKIKIFNDHKRLGKAQRLNHLLALNKSDYIAFFDADIILGGKYDLEYMVDKITSSKNLNVVAANQTPSRPINFLNRISNASFNLLKEMATYNNSNHIHSLQGSASIINGEFAKKLKYPNNTLSDQGYLYIKSIENNKNRFAYERRSSIIFQAVSTFIDYRLISARTVTDDKNNLSDVFGKKILKAYRVPKTHLLKSILIRTAKDPIFTPLSIILNIYVRIFPYKKTKNNHGLWDTISSSKNAIKIQ